MEQNEKFSNSVKFDNIGKNDNNASKLVKFYIPQRFKRENQYF